MFDDLPVRDKLVRNPLPMKKKINAVRTDLLGDGGEKFLNKINKGVSPRLRKLMKKLYGFNPENS
ncbi:MAG: hypothetical protein NT136_04225 [Candidatus Moranbacteria bacterium]|nr:hypothetical protein [Candidatus Moranbacteria bacterium]